MFFSHGSSHSRGVLVLVRDNLDFQLRSIKVDSQGRYVFLEVSIQDSPYFLLNIYAPNKCSEQCTFRGTQRICSSLYLFPIGILLAGKILGVLMSWLGNFLLLEALAGNY